MQVGVVKLSDLAREGRWDAGFHLTLQSVQERVTELRETVSKAEAIERLDALPLSAKASLAVLRRGQTARSMSESDAQTVTREYPHLSLALIEKNRDASIAKLLERIAKDEAAIEQLRTIGAPAASGADA